MSTLGGYDSSVGRAAHQADAPTRIPVPSLLRSLLTDHLDPGYAAAAQAGKRSRASSVLWQVLAAVVVVLVLPVLFLHGRVGADAGLHRSDDGGGSWRRIDHDGMRMGGVMRHVTGDPRLHGRVYFGTEGRGIWYGDPQ